MGEQDQIPPGVEIYSRGCVDRYVGIRRGEAHACSCPERKCWVTYARAQHLLGLPALSYGDWKKEQSA